MRIPTGRPNSDVPPPESLKGLCFDVMREVVAQLDDEQKIIEALYDYHTGYPEDGLWSALHVAQASGITIPAAYRPLVEAEGEKLEDRDVLFDTLDLDSLFE